jgi:hypothetical protein
MDEAELSSAQTHPSGRPGVDCVPGFHAVGMLNGLDMSQIYGIESYTLSNRHWRVDQVAPAP